MAEMALNLIAVEEMAAAMRHNYLADLAQHLVAHPEQLQQLQVEVDRLQLVQHRRLELEELLGIGDETIDISITGGEFLTRKNSSVDFLSLILVLDLLVKHGLELDTSSSVS